MRTGRKIGPLLLSLFVGLSVLAAVGVSHVSAKGTGPTYSCSVSVTYTTNTFYVKTTVKATGGPAGARTVITTKVDVNRNVTDSIRSRVVRFS
jgi:hypothetical protein